MKIELKNLYDKKGKVHNEMKDAYRLVSERDGKPTTEERAKFQAWDAEMISLDEQIDFRKREEQIELITESNKVIRNESENNSNKRYDDKISAAERRIAIDKAKKVGYTALTDSERVAVDTDERDMKIFERMLRGAELNADEQRIVGGYREKRVGAGQLVGTTTAGGYTVPEGFAGRIVEYMAKVSDLLNWANIIRTATGQVIPYPINDDNSNTGELISEAGDISTSSADLVFSVHNMSAYKLSSKMVKVSAELAQDNGVNLIDYLAKKLGIRTGKVANTYYTTGTGSSQPKGFLQTRGKVTASTSTWTQAELVALQDSIDPMYDSGRVAFSMHQNILSELKQLSLGTNYNTNIWIPSFRDGAPSTILGKPYFLNQAMSSTSATGDKIIAYGDWSKFNVRIVNDITLKVLTERYAEFDQSAYFSLMRTDSFLEDTTAVKYMDIS